MVRWIAMAISFAAAAVTAYWAYGSFDAIASPNNDTAPGIFIVLGSVFSLASLAAVIGGITFFVLWPRFRDRDPRPRRARRV
jgi:membrane associated rhomboid family serine protease